MAPVSTQADGPVAEARHRRLPYWKTCGFRRTGRLRDFFHVGVEVTPAVALLLTLGAQLQQLQIVGQCRDPHRAHFQQRHGTTVHADRAAQGLAGFRPGHREGRIADLHRQVRRAATDKSCRVGLHFQ
jgi:hypothetical protein